MSLAEFEPAIPKSERLQTNALDRAATEIGDGASLGPNWGQTQKVKKCTNIQFKISLSTRLHYSTSV